MTVGRITHPTPSAARVATGRISPNGSKIASISSSNAKRLLFGMGPDPAETKRYCEENDRNERQRCIERYSFDPYTCRSLSSTVSSSSSSSSNSSSSSSSSMSQQAMNGKSLSSSSSSVSPSSHGYHHQHHHHHHHHHNHHHRQQ
ncbi:protein bunched, class 2/F/G isoform-like [Anopheles darlingi]|uniref:protein bunched, class 2/F/G isoform-like n=1 Tax=Anopheles darlingi TaxID=43151 RepID=UPI002100629E|nr:protein bunched, class 2/F/G isoform-like [Anopheles darlingi]